MVKTFDPTTVYQSAEEIADFVYTRITPVLLLISVMVRATETQLDVSSGLGKWERMLRDFLMYGLFISVYFAIMGLFNHFMNEVYGMIGPYASLDDLRVTMKDLLLEVDKPPPSSSQIMDSFNELVAKAKLPGPLDLAADLLFWAASIFLVFSDVLMKGAFGVTYGFVLVWGLIALPCSITRSFSLVKGWSVLLAGVFLTPVVETLFLSFFGSMFKISAKVITLNLRTKQLYLAGDYHAQFQVFFSIITVIFALILLVSPVIAGMLVMNGNAMSGFVAPFAGGAVSAGLAALNLGKSAAMMAGGAVAGGAAVGGAMGMSSKSGGEKPNFGAPSGWPGGSGPGGGGPEPRPSDVGGGSAPGLGGSKASGGGSTPGGSGRAPSPMSGDGDSPSPRPDPQGQPETQDSEQAEAKRKKRKDGKTGHFRNQWRKNNAPKPKPKG